MDDDVIIKYRQGTVGVPVTELNPLPVTSGAVPTATPGALASATGSTQVVPANRNRRGLVATNTDANTCYLKYGTAASATSFTVPIPTGGYWEMPAPIYTGVIHAAWAADGTGSLIWTEL